MNSPELAAKVAELEAENQEVFHVNECTLKHNARLRELLREWQGYFPATITSRLASASVPKALVDDTRKELGQ